VGSSLSVGLRVGGHVDWQPASVRAVATAA
jgi:hypothetical protein